MSLINHLNMMMHGGWRGGHHFSPAQLPGNTCRANTSLLCGLCFGEDTFNLTYHMATHFVCYLNSLPSKPLIKSKNNTYMATLPHQKHITAPPSTSLCL